MRKQVPTLNAKGFKNVYQLEGGIIEYTRQVKARGLDNKFRGKNFVFDHRRAEQISDEVIAVLVTSVALRVIHVNCANEACHFCYLFNVHLVKSKQ